MIKKLSKEFKKKYINFVYSNRLIKLLKAFHYEKIIYQELTLNKTDKCLLLAPHPDDETFGCGGMLLKYPENFEVICLTDGRFGGHDDDPDELIETRKQEFSSVMNQLNISSYSMLGIKDRKLIYNYETFKSLNIEEFNYIFIPNYFDQHKDHKAVTNLLQKLLINKKHNNNLKIVFYEVWSALAYSNYFIDLTDTIEKKKELINIYKSQIKYVDFLNGISSLNAYRGMLVDKSYAEFFSIIDIKTFMKF